MFFCIFVSEQLPALPPESLLLLLLPHLASVRWDQAPISPALWDGYGQATFRPPTPGDLQGRGPAPPSALSASASALRWGVGSSLTLERFSWFPRAQASPSRLVRSLLTCCAPAGKDGARSPGPCGERAAGALTLFQGLIGIIALLFLPNQSPSGRLSHLRMGAAQKGL